MNFLAPLFLFGALAVAEPIIFHLIRRTTRDVKPFSSLMFLQPTPPRVTRRSRIENLWLLLLRCLVLVALALGFARPFFRQGGAKNTGATGPGRRIAILVDTSASMRRETLWKQARERAEAILRSTTPLDTAAVVTFDRTSHVLVDMERWRTMPVGDRVSGAVRQLAAASPGWSGTNLGAAILQALDLISGAREATPTRGEIIVISDMEEGARLDGLQGLEWPASVTVRFENVTASKPGNAAAQWLAGGEEKETQGAEDGMRVRVSNSAESKAERFRLAWGAGADAGLDVYVPAGQSRVVRVPKLPAGVEKVTLTGDDADFDNTLWLLPPQPRRVPVMFFGADADDDTRGSLFYLRRAFQQTTQETFEVTARRANEPVATFEIQKAQLVVLGDGASDAQIAAARQFARDGHFVVVPLTGAESARALSRLLEVPEFAAAEAVVRDYALLAQIDFQSPLFAPFADPRFSDFTKIHFWHHRKLDSTKFPGARMLASFDDRDPAILRVPLGKGGVIVFTSSWRPADSQLALSSKFVPLMHAILDESAGLPPARAQYFVGDEIALPPGTQPFTMRKPDGTEVAVAAGGKFAGTDQPGIYVANPGELRFVVNLDPEESRTSPLARDRLAALALPMDATGAAQAKAADTGVHAQATEAEQRQKLWRWLVAAAVTFLLAETAIAAKLSRPRSHPWAAS
ncbi:MAG: BatA domain-containing protein [Chthoniobacteraceae bacterium]